MCVRGVKEGETEECGKRKKGKKKALAAADVSMMLEKRVGRLSLSLHAV
jgi:hypothetical protein